MGSLRPVPRCYPDPVSRPRPSLLPDRALWVLTFVCVLTGCADMLGLGGLSYDRTEGAGEEQSGGSASVSASGGSAGTLGSPPTAPDDPEAEYPIDLGPGLIVAAEYQGIGPQSFRADSQVFFGRAGSPTLTLFQMSSTEDDSAGAAAVARPFSHLVAPRTVQGLSLILYDQASGIVRFGPVPEPDADFLAEESAGSSGWTSLVLTGPGHAPTLFSFDTTSGDHRYGPADWNTDEPNIRWGTWPGSWSRVVAFARGSQWGVLRLDAGSGAVEFVALDGPEAAEAESLGSVTQGWSLAASYQSQAGPRLLLYYPDGSIIALSESKGSLTPADASLWRRDMTDMVPIFIDGQPWALTYAKSTGILDLVSLEPLEADQIGVVK